MYNVVNKKTEENVYGCDTEEAGLAYIKSRPVEEQKLLYVKYEVESGRPWYWNHPSFKNRR